MKVLLNNQYVDIDLGQTIALGSIVDNRVPMLEARVCDYYDVNTVFLHDWRYDSTAKNTLCFLLYMYCHYSLGSISKQYNINAVYLRNCIAQSLNSYKNDLEYKEFIDAFLTGFELVAKAS